VLVARGAAGQDDGMTTYAYRILNVFTLDGDRLSGNPLCVFEDARGLDDATLLALARQLNLSETTFLLPARDPRADARVRIFTPGYEMPFAGHPTLGTAHVVGALQGKANVTLEMIAGLVPVARERGTSVDGSVVEGGRATRSADDRGRWTLRAAQAPVTRPFEADRATLARMVGLPESALGEPPLWVTTGVEQLVIPIATASAVRAAKPDRALLEQHGYSAARSEAMAYLWAADEPEWTVRFFFTSNGSVLEDPATGSACANLGGWHVATGRPLPVVATLRQGDATGRPSRLELRVDADRGIHVTGGVIELGRGTLAL
jgi:trans-2,3-dihydro-3-hydroxyanthranilate isomerase